MATLQDWIYKLEEGTGSRYLRFALGLIAFVAVASVFQLAAFRNLWLPEGMETAQLARNISEGNGFSTDMVRPLSLHLLQKQRTPGPDDAGGESATPVQPITGLHPDLANPPFYPLMLSVALKLMPESFYEIDTSQRFVTFKADRWVALFNQFLMCVAACLVFVLGLKLFDPPVAWVSALLFVGADLFWQFSISGLSTMLLTVIFLGLTLVLVLMQGEAREELPSGRRLIVLAVGAGCLVGFGALTRYSFAWAMVPVVMVIITQPGQRQGVYSAVAVVVFGLVIAPWLLRNYAISGMPLGTAGFAIYEGTSFFPEGTLQRSLDPQLGELRTEELVDKLATNLRSVFEDDIPRLGGSWMTAFFLVGLLIPFRNPTRRAMRWYLLACVGVFAVMQSAARTSSGGAVEPVSAENLVVIVAPFVFIYGTSFFFILLDQTTQVPWVRYFASGILWAIVSTPLLLSVIHRPASPVNYPPYYPPWIQEKSARVDVGATILTDIPWAVAWYGQRRGVWLSLYYQNNADDLIREDFAAVDALQPVDALYLTGVTLKALKPESLREWRSADGDIEDFILLRGLLIGNWEVGGNTSEDDLRLLAAFRNGLHKRWAQRSAAKQDWESFVVGTLIKREVPKDFPFRAAFEEMLPEIFLTDSERIRTKAIQSE